MTEEEAYELWLRTDATLKRGVSFKKLVGVFAKAVEQVVHATPAPKVTNEQAWKLFNAAKEGNRQFSEALDAFLAERATPADHIGDAAEKVDAQSVPVAEMPLTSGAGPQKLAWFKHPDSFAPGTKLYAQSPQPEAQSVRDAWISVDERLPEQHEWVLVSDGTWSWIGMHLDDEDLEPNKRWMDESAELIESNGIKITHWMPMPAPPQKPVSDEVKP